ncbi:38960_t:CDS:1, partial [Gigaspora margarita]
REQRHKRSEIRQAKRRKIYIEKDVQANEAHVPLRVLEMYNEFN